MASKWLLTALVGTTLGLPAVVRAEEQPQAPSAPLGEPGMAAPAAAETAPASPPTDMKTTPAPMPAGQPSNALPPLPDDLPPGVRAYLEAIQKHVKDLEDKLNQQQKENSNPPGSYPTPGSPKTKNPVPSARSLTSPRGSRLQIGGYAELRATNLGNAVGDRTGPHDNIDFQVARFRPKFTYYIDPRWEADLQINASTRSTSSASFTARDAYLEYHNGRNNEYAVRFGQQKVPFGFETFLEGDEFRPAMERARYHEVFVPDQRDVGATFILNPRKLPSGDAYQRGELYAIGIYNGNSINKQDNDLSKTIVAEARYPIGHFITVGVSGLAGTFSPSVGETHVRQALNLDLETYFGRFRTQTEFMMGRNLGKDVTGGYAQVEYQTGRPGNFFTRFDYYDRDEDLSHDLFKRWGIGWYKDFTKNVRITAEYDFVTNLLTQTRHPNTFGLEFQVNW